MWQTCPLCKGTGTTGTILSMNYQTCPVCNGEKIISELNGRPPGFGKAEQTGPKVQDLNKPITSPFFKPDYPKETKFGPSKDNPPIQYGFMSIEDFFSLLSKADQDEINRSDKE